MRTITTPLVTWKHGKRIGITVHTTRMMDNIKVILLEPPFSHLALWLFDVMVVYRFLFVRLSEMR